MRPSGFFSNWALSRKYGRDNRFFEEKPNAVILFNTNIGENSDKLKGYCQNSENNVPFHVLQPAEITPRKFNSLFKTFKNNLKTYYIKKWANDKFNEGLQKGLFEKQKLNVGNVFLNYVI